MTGPDALDYSWSRPSAASLRAAGIQLVARYLSHDDSKDLSQAEAGALHAAGIGILLNWESDAGRPLLGSTAGAQDGRDAAARAESRGAPHGLTIYYSCDTDTQPSQWPTIAAYYRAAGAATVGRYKVGVYGEADLVDYLHKQGVVTSEWQTYAWSGGRLSAESDLYQYLNGQTLAGASVDFDRIIHPALLGAWWPNGEGPLGGGVPLTNPQPADWFDTVDEATMQKMLDKLGNRIIVGDPQHLDTTSGIRVGISNLDDKIDLIRFGDGPHVAPGADTHAANLKVLLSLARAAVNPAAIAAAVVAALPAQANLTEAQIEQALRNVLHNA